jgi:hypothetical protein
LWWRAAEREYKDSFKRQHPHIGRVEITETHPFQLRDFWFGSDYQEHTIDAKMLRTADACQITGFDDWWQRLTRLLKEAAFTGGIHWSMLFSLCRTSYAMREMRQSLQLNLQGLEASSVFPDLPLRNFSPRFGLPYRARSIVRICKPPARPQKPSR